MSRKGAGADYPVHPGAVPGRLSALRARIARAEAGLTRTEDPEERDRAWKVRDEAERERADLEWAVRTLEGLLLLPRCGACGKRVHASREGAEEHVRSLLLVNHARPRPGDPPLVAYLCQLRTPSASPGWHAGHDKYHGKGLAPGQRAG